LKAPALTRRAVAKKTATKRKVVISRPVKQIPPRPRSTKVTPVVSATKPQPKVAGVRAKTKTAALPSPLPAAKEPMTRKPVRKSPAVERARRSWDDSVVPGPPSSLDFNRNATAARSGRRELLERHENHTETGPTLTGGDIDADWESAYSVGDEAPGGDSPTPDQDLVDDIGLAVGVAYEDDEELKGEEKISSRDRHRWELDPGSSDDFEDR
jgi:hypothetical protein